jgi:biopolymer transport protein ExbB
MWKTLRLLVGASFLLGSAAFAQSTQNTAVQAEAERTKAAAALEEARQDRDRIVMERWQDKKQANDFRENFQEKYRAAREKLDLAAAERSAVMEELRALKEDMESFREGVEKARSEFIVLSAQDDKVEGLVQSMEASVPFEKPERIQQTNRLKGVISEFKDKPEVVVDSLFAQALRELAFTRQMETKQGELIFGAQDVGYGYKTRLGGVGGVQYDKRSQKAAVLLSSGGKKGRGYIWQEVPPQVLPQIKAMYTAPPTGDSAVVHVPVDVLLSSSLSREIAAQEELSWRDKVQRFMADGGPLMYPILGMFVLALLLAMERLWYWMRARKLNEALRDEVLALCEKQSWEEASEKAKSLKGARGKVIQTILSRAQQSRDAAEKSLQEVLVNEIPALERRVRSIQVLGALAPLLGLLGTVYGMIHLFEVITLHGTSDPKLLAGGISIALVTTETGLAVAIPVQLVHNFVRNRIEGLISSLEAEALRFLNAIWKEG